MRLLLFILLIIVCAKTKCENEPIKPKRTEIGSFYGLRYDFIPEKIWVETNYYNNIFFQGTNSTVFVKIHDNISFNMGTETPITNLQEEIIGNLGFTIHLDL